ncbi:MAG: phage tail assembly protein [Magnetospirillum sp.]|nr:phage tail assembly protein [Magnetospirillum sp.]
MKKITLDYPLNLPPHPPVAELTMRRPKVRDEMEAKKGRLDEGEIEIALFALLTAQAPEVIHELDMADYDKLQEALRDFRKKPEAKSSGAAPTT